MPPTPPIPNRRVVLAGMAGNVLEWYDFGLYGLLAPTLARLFFPAHDRIAALLGVYGGFAIGFTVRPLGALVLGRLGDRIGRRYLLVLSIVLMGLATVIVGLLPTYAAAGLWAAVLLLATRLFQGFSVGGEFVGSVTYLVETAPPGRRGLAGSVANIGATVGMLLAAAAAALAVGWGHAGPPPSWAWRMPFLLGGLLALAAYGLRRRLPESLPATAGPAVRAPLRQAAREVPHTLIAMLLLTSGYGVVNYVGMVFLPTFAHEFGHVAESATLRINTVGQALALLIVPLAGWASDHLLRRRTLLILAFSLEALLAWPLLAAAGHGGPSGLWVAQLALAALLAVIMGAAPALLAEQFPAGYRVTAHAVAFNLGIGIAGGTAPLVALALIRWTASPMAPAFYLIFAALVAAASALAMHDRSREALD